MNTDVPKITPVLQSEYAQRKQSNKMAMDYLQLITMHAYRVENVFVFVQWVLFNQFKTKFQEKIKKRTQLCPFYFLSPKTLIIPK